ncbi:hypothetical protein PS676_04786 [Pseudomonas fluorescens]|nr:hypothetical protein PS676_04786 [Pseudomonas fluorescens]
MGVDLSGRQIAVAEQHLHHPQIGAVVEQVRGEGVTQGVRRQRLADPGDLGLMLDAVPERLARHLLAALTGEHDIAGTSAEQLLAAIAHITLDPDNRLLAHWHQPLLAALAHHPQHALTQVDLLQRQADQFRHPQAAGVKHFEHGAVTLADRITQIRRLQQRFHIGFRQGFWQRPTELRHIDA